MTHRTAYLHCSYPGCSEALTVDAKHIPNLTASGGYDCGQHHQQEPCN